MSAFESFGTDEVPADGTAPAAASWKQPADAVAKNAAVPLKIAKAGILGAEVGGGAKAVNGVMARPGVIKEIFHGGAHKVLKDMGKLGKVVGAAGKAAGGAGAAIDIYKAGKILADPSRRKGVGTHGEVAHHALSAGTSIWSLFGGPLGMAAAAGYTAGSLLDKLSGAKKGETTGISGAIANHMHLLNPKRREREIKHQVAMANQDQTLPIYHKQQEIQKLQGALAGAKDAGQKERLSKIIAKLQGEVATLQGAVRPISMPAPAKAAPAPPKDSYQQQHDDARARRDAGLPMKTAADRKQEAKQTAAVNEHDRWRSLYRACLDTHGKKMSDPEPVCRAITESQLRQEKGAAK